MNESFFCSTSLPAFGIVTLLDFGHSNRCVDVRAGPQRRLSAEELMLSNCGAAEDS